MDAFACRFRMGFCDHCEHSFYASLSLYHSYLSLGSRKGKIWGNVGAGNPSGGENEVGRGEIFRGDFLTFGWFSRSSFFKNALLSDSW